MKKCDKNIVKPCLYDEKCEFARKAPCRIKLTAGQKMQVAQTSGRTKRGTLCKLHILTKNEKFCLTAGLAGVTMWTNQNHGNGAGQVHPARRFCYLSIWLNAARKNRGSAVV
ncbi:MAG: hypothetical protein PUF35_08025 [Subdoligranulum sp.]|nr:hypothetical protein [Subdoligranulum sp.]MDD6714705.1 hypothetical protein [Subdoligranulum sp.]